MRLAKSLPTRSQNPCPRPRRATTAVLGSATAALPVQNLKHDRVGRAGIDSQEELKGKAFAAVHRLQKLPRIVRGFYRDPNLRYITTE